MKALIFAAGRGERMRPLSDRIPKPLLAAGGRMLIEWQITALVAAGIRELVINTAHHARLTETRRRASQVPPPSSGARGPRRGASGMVGLPASPFAPRR